MSISDSHSDSGRTCLRRAEVDDTGVSADVGVHADDRPGRVRQDERRGNRTSSTGQIRVPHRVDHQRLQ